jgi:hypothetical protein
MAETQSTTTTTTEATAPTGDIKVFIDAFNKDFDAELKKLVDTQQNYKNVYADAIKITTPKEGPWPNDPKVVTIGDLFKYTFPDIESDKVVQPPDYELGDSPEGDKWENRKGWEKDLKNSKDEKIKKMYSTIFSGIKSNKNIKKYQELKKPGVTNPSLWSPGQYYFDVFMKNFIGSRETKPSSFLKDPYQSITDDKLSVIESGKNDFLEFTDAIYSLSDMIVYTTDINIGLKEKEDKSSLFPSLQTQYKSGLWSELVPKKYENDQFYKDKEFDSRRGDFDSGQPKKFIGYYEHILLYKAFLQAGDNYKSVVLPRENPEPPTPAPEVAKPVVNLPQEVGYTFNVEKKDSFVIVGGSMSGVEFTIVPNDGTQYIIETPSDIFGTDEDLDPEYMEGDFTGTEEGMVEYDINIALVDNFNYQDNNNNNNNNNNNTTNTSNDAQTANLANITPGEQVKHLYEYIQKRVKKGYKYLGTPVYNVSEADLLKLLSITKKYGIPFEWVANLINHESAGTWNPSIRNSIGATGLIQFMTLIGGKSMTYAKADGSEPVNTDTLRSMTFNKHLDYVDGFLSRGTKKRLNNGKVKKEYTQTDLFMTIFMPAAVGKPGYIFSAGVQKSNGGITRPIDYTKKACNQYSPFPLVPQDLVNYVAKFGNGLIENSNVA